MNFSLILTFPFLFLSALGHLSNIQNSIFMPNIGSYFERRPTHTLPTMAPNNAVRKTRERTSGDDGDTRVNQDSLGRKSRKSQRSDQESDLSNEVSNQRTSTPAFQDGQKIGRKGSRPVSMLTRVSSAMSFGTNKVQTPAAQDQDANESVYSNPEASDGEEADEDDEDDERGFTEEEKLERRREKLENQKHIDHWKDLDEDERNQLDEHVKALLTKKAKFRRGMKGFWAFVKTREYYMTALSSTPFHENHLLKLIQSNFACSVELHFPFSYGIHHDALRISHHLLGNCHHPIYLQLD